MPAYGFAAPFDAPFRHFLEPILFASLRLTPLFPSPDHEKRRKEGTERPYSRRRP
jgi:hypothetical protein